MCVGKCGRTSSKGATYDDNIEGLADGFVVELCVGTCDVTNSVGGDVGIGRAGAVALYSFVRNVDSNFPQKVSAGLADADAAADEVDVMGYINLFLSSIAWNTALSFCCCSFISPSSWSGRGYRREVDIQMIEVFISDDGSRSPKI